MKFVSEKYGSFDVVLRGFEWVNLYEFDEKTPENIQRTFDKLNKKCDVTFEAEESIITNVLYSESLDCTVVLNPYPMFIVESSSGATLPPTLCKDVERDLSKEMTAFAAKELPNLRELYKNKLIDNLETQVYDIKSMIDKVEEVLCSLT